MATFTIDPWKNKTSEHLKADCRRLSRALSDWQKIALRFSGKHGIDALTLWMRIEVSKLMEEYKD